MCSQPAAITSFHLLSQHVRVSTTQRLLIGVPIGPLVDAEPGQDVRSSDGLLYDNTCRRGFTRDLPIVSKIEPGIAQGAYYGCTLNSKTSRSERLPHHLVHRNAIDAL